MKTNTVPLINTNYMRFFFSILFLLTSTFTFSQELSNEEIKEFAKTINNRIQGKRLDNGIIIKSCYSIDRTLVYNYEVPSNWRPYDNIKQFLIDLAIDNGSSKLFYEGNIDVWYQYTSGTKLVKSVKIDSNDFFVVNYELNKDFINLKKREKIISCISIKNMKSTRGDVSLLIC